MCKRHWCVEVLTVLKNKKASVSGKKNVKNNVIIISMYLIPKENRNLLNPVSAEYFWTMVVYQNMGEVINIISKATVAATRKCTSFSTSYILIQTSGAEATIGKNAIELLSLHTEDSDK